MLNRSDCPTLSDYIVRYQVDGILWKADRLLKDIDSPIKRNEYVTDIARTIALLPATQQVVKDHYITTIAKEHNLTRKTLEKLVTESQVIERKKGDLARTVRKNQVDKLKGDPKTFPFFYEKENKEGDVRVIVDKLRFVQLLASFGFTRYSTDADSRDGFAFVKLTENVIAEVSKEEIIDHLEHFVQKEYDFDAAGCKDADADKLINVFYDNINKLFSKDLFARVRISTPIVINRDTKTETFLYYQNGFVRVTATDYELVPFEQMNGSVWAKQMLPRKFTKKSYQVAGNGDGTVDFDQTFTTDRPLGDFADFVWRVSDQKQQRFISLCSILGYLMHDYYDYKLKSIILTDSIVSEKNEGRTGKTLLMKMLGFVRSYCEVNGKTFDITAERKYELADRSTQILHLNDVTQKGRFKFFLEPIYNDITEGYMVRKMYASPFRQRSKMVISTNKSLEVEGGSARDRVLEFEMSSFFSEHRNPENYYGRRLGDGWDEDEWTKYDNFVCFCAGIFLKHGLIPPETINLEKRKLLDQTCREFLEFMGDISDEIKSNGTPPATLEAVIADTQLFNPVNKPTLADFEFDKSKLFNHFVTLYPDFKANHFSQKRFTIYLQKYATLGLGLKEAIERRSNGKFLIQFKEKQP